MRQYKVHVLYEHGLDMQPYSCSHIRLLRPLTHPAISDTIAMTTGIDYTGEQVDAVIVDRLWRTRISPSLVEDLLTRVHRAGARLIYALDDNFFELVGEHKDWSPTPEQLQAVELFLKNADGVFVTTEMLRERFADLGSRIALIPNALDERLIPAHRRSLLSNFALRCARWARRARADAPTVIGYMGTRTHDDDLLMILPALKAVCARHAGRVTIEIIGVLVHSETQTHLAGLPLRFIDPGPENRDYPAFLSWFTRLFWWDISLAPLRDTSFNRYKSDIKFLDYDTISTVGIYSRMPAYASSVAHLKTGWLAENDPGAWEEALEALLASVPRRLWMGYNAARYLYGRRTLSKTATRWLAAIEDVVAR